MTVHTGKYAIRQAIPVPWECTLTTDATEKNIIKIETSIIAHRKVSQVFFLLILMKMQPFQSSQSPPK